jgi:hypothetical protein
MRVMVKIANRAQVYAILSRDFNPRWPKTGVGAVLETPNVEPIAVPGARWEVRAQAPTTRVSLV